MGQYSESQMQLIVDIRNAIAAVGASARIPEGTPVNAVAANKALTIDGVVIDGETVTLGNAVYEFTASAAQTVDTGHIAVDIESATTKSTGTLTVDTQPTSGDTMTIGTKVYTFVPVDTANAEGEIDIGANLSEAQANIVAAINGTDDHNSRNNAVSAAAFDGNNCTITALIGGTIGDGIATTETFAAGSNKFAADNLSGGVDCSKGDAKTALLAAVLANATKDVEAVDGTGDIVTCRAVTKGTAGNSIVIGENMAHGAFAGAATALSGGIDGTVGTKLQMLQDASYLYVCTANNTIVDANWRRVSLSAY
jgi:hypothetical protein